MPNAWRRQAFLKFYLWRRDVNLDIFIHSSRTTLTAVKCRKDQAVMFCIEIKANRDHKLKLAKSRLTSYVLQYKYYEIVQNKLFDFTLTTVTKQNS